MNKGQKFPFDGSVDLFGKPFTIDDKNLRKAQNLVPDGDNNLVRRGAMAFEAVLEGTVYSLRPVDSSQDYVQGNKPIWLSIVPIGNGLYITMVTNGERSEFVFAYPAKSLPKCYSINAMMTTPSLLPSQITMFGETYLFFGPHSNADGSTTFGSGIRITFPVGGTGGGYLGANGPQDYKVEDVSFEDESNAALMPFLATVCRQRVWYGNFGYENDKQNMVIVSDVQSPLTVGEAAITDRNFIIGAGDGDRLTALHTVLLSGLGSPAQTAVLALKTYSAYLLTGEPNQSVDDSDYEGTLQVNRISSNAGCISAATIVDTPWGTIWCGVDDVWFMPFGAVPYPIGRALKPLLKLQPEGQRFRCHAVMSGGFYRLALFSDGQGPIHDTPLGEQWWLDLRNGPPSSWQEARWFGPQVFNPLFQLRSVRLDGIAHGDDPCTEQGTSFMVTDPRPGQDGRLYGVQRSVIFNLTAPYVPPTGLVSGLCLVSYDAPNARDVAGFSRPALAPWIASHVYNLGEEIVVFESAALINPTAWIVVASGGAGASGVTQPNWIASGGFQGDGDLTWARLGSCIAPPGSHGTEIAIEIHSKEYNAGIKILEKLWQGVELNILLGTPERMKLTQMVDAGKTSDVILFDLDNMEGPDVGNDYFDGDGALATFTEEYQSIGVWSDESTRTIGRTCQLKLAEVLGIYLPSTEFGITVGFVEYLMNLPTNWYASAAQLGQAVSDAINALGAPGNDMEFASTQTGLFQFIGNGSNLPWAPSISTPERRLIWTLLGFTVYAGNEFVDNTANEMVYDISIGTFGINEGVIRYRPFKRRPLQ